MVNNKKLLIVLDFFKENKNNEETFNDEVTEDDFEWSFPTKTHFFTNTDNVFNHRTYDIYQKHEINLQNYQGEVLLVVNVASFWSLTYQYLKLNELQYKFYEDGFRILGKFDSTAKILRILNSRMFSN